MSDHIKNLLFIAGTYIAFILISFPYITDPYFFFPDAERIAMDGVFILDVFRDLPGSILHPLEYVQKYYAQYPALSTGYRPPFFALVTSGFYAVFGLSYLSPKISVLFFLFVGMIFWYLLVEKTHGSRVALGSLVLWLSVPMIFQYSQYTMLEIPTLAMVIVSTYALYMYVAKPTFLWGLILGIAMGLTFWTNQKSGFLLFALPLYPVLAGQWRIFFRKESFFFYAILAFFLVPLAAMTLWLGDQNLSQALPSGGSEGRMLGWLTVDKILLNIKFLYSDHLSLVLLFFSVTGLLFAAFNKDRNSLIYGCLIISIYVFFTYVRHNIPRYSMYWIPFFCFFAVIGIQKMTYYLKEKIPVHQSFIFICLLLVPFSINLFKLPSIQIPYSQGYEKAAEYVIKHSKSPIVFFHGYGNGQFTFFLRSLDHDRKMIIVRADKIFTSSSISWRRRVTVHVDNHDEMKEYIKSINQQFIVIEAIHPVNMRLDEGFRKVFDDFRILLNDDESFVLRKIIDVQSNYYNFKDQKILIYENLMFTEQDLDKIKLHLPLPVVGQGVEVNIGDILSR